MKLLKFCLPYIILASGTILIFTSFALVPTDQFEHYFLNSDCMYLPSVYKDIFINKNDLSLWSFNAAPNVFPDMFLHFIIMSITDNIIHTAIAFAIIQYIIIGLLSDYIFRNISKNHTLTSRFFLQLLVLLPHSFTLYSSDFALHFHYLNNAFHLGALVNTLLAWSILISIVRLKKIRFQIFAFIGLCALLFVFSISDKLFWLLCLAPFFVYFLFQFLAKKNKIYLLFSSFLLLTFVMSSWTLNGLRYSKPRIDLPYRNLSTEFIGESSMVFFDQMKIELSSQNIKSVFFILVFVSLALLIYLAVRTFILILLKKSVSSTNPWNPFLASCVFLGIFAPIANGSYTGFDCIRYNFPAMIIALIALGIIAAPLINKLSIWLLLIPTLFLVFQWSDLLINKYPDLIAKINFKPDETKSLEFVINAYDLKAGVAPYWHAKKNEHFNSNGIKILPILDQRGMYIHANNKQWYLTENGSSNKQYFDFAIANTQEEVNSILTYFECDCPVLKEKYFFIIITPKFSFDPVSELMIKEEKN